MLAIANEAGVDFQLKDINVISQRVSHIAKISPSLSTIHMEDINRAGGVNAVMKEMTKRGDEVLLDNLTIGGETLFEKIADAEIKDTNVIRRINNPYSQVGGLAILYGNLAEQGAVIKSAGLTGSRVFTGKAVCYDGQAEAIAGILAGEVKAGDVVVIRYEGPKGTWNARDVESYEFIDGYGARAQ
jgi:dihydroxy-acid dehydratase